MTFEVCLGPSCLHTTSGLPLSGYREDMMRWSVLAGLVWFGLGSASAQTTCPPTPAYSPCELVFELSAEEAAAHPNPYVTVELQAEFNSPRHRTWLMPAFWDGGRKMVIRFAPNEEGAWEYRITSNLKRLDDQKGTLTATASSHHGFVQRANVHHWSYTTRNEMAANPPHLWMGATEMGFATMDRAAFEQIVTLRSSQKFNHLRGLVLREGAFGNPDRPDHGHFQELDQRLRVLNSKGMTADLIIGNARGQLARQFPEPEQRERYIRYLVSRYSAFDITWQGVPEFEDYSDGRALLKEFGGLLKRLDPYQHVRTSGARVTSAPLAGDGWLDCVTYGSADDQLGAIEHQLYPMPFLNQTHLDGNPDTVRRRVWNAAMNGQYPAFDLGGAPDGPAAKAMTTWRDFWAGTRYWELEPYFDVDGGRAVALVIDRSREFERDVEAIEYVIYVEKPSGPVEVAVNRHKYDVAWINPLTGERVPQKEFKGERWVGEPPDRSHDWVLHISREGKKEGMLKSYKFESRPILMQEVEANSPKVPFSVDAPLGEELSLKGTHKYSAKLTKTTRGTRSMMYLWTGEATADGQGFRMIGSGPQGNFQIPPGLARTMPGVLNLRVVGMNANGKVYAIDKVFRLTP